jgi:magnesium-transporting ATPase (P-type)
MVREEAVDDLKSLPMAELQAKLGSSPDGLSQAEAQKRLAQYGPNDIEEKKTNPLLKFLTYLWGPIPWMIEAAVVLSAVARHWPDFAIILLLLLANAVVGFWEEHQAGNAIAALKAKLAIKARVKRDGKWITPEARELVPGDVIRLRLGDIVLMTPGLSVIIDAIKESRKIFQRMNSYAIYRIAETLRVLSFMTLSILIFNFYPLTAVMIVMLALLNDGAILSIAYDKVHYKVKPEAWNMHMVLGVSSVLGVIGVVASFGLFYLGERVFYLDRAHIQTLMYLKLSVAGQLTIFLTRTRGPFWSIRPARILWVAVLGAQTVATLIAVYGLFMTPLGWG